MDFLWTDNSLNVFLNSRDFMLSGIPFVILVDHLSWLIMGSTLERPASSRPMTMHAQYFSSCAKIQIQKVVLCHSLVSYFLHLVIKTSVGVDYTDNILYNL